MPASVNRSLVTLAREARGLSQSGLAAQLGISQAHLSKLEGGAAVFSPELLDRVSTALDFPVSFFEQDTAVHGPGTSAHHIMYRRRVAVGVNELRRVQAFVNILRMNVEVLLRGAIVNAVRPIPLLDPDEYDGDVERIAREIRATWLVPLGPIADVTKLIELAGGIVIPYDFGENKIDATSLRVAGLPPLFLVSSSLPGDRLRFTLAHELAHVVMHSAPHPDMERQADRFAAEFLMPGEEIAGHLAGLTIAKAAQLKPYWKVSMGALIKRAHDLGKLSPTQYERLWTQMGAMGYRTREPASLDLHCEAPTTLKRIIDFHRSSLQYSDEDLAALLRLSPAEFARLYGPSPRRALRVVGK